MKTVSVVLTQEPESGFFRVQSFTNTVQLSIGQIVPAAKVGEWCTIPRVNVRVVGLTRTETEDSQTLLTDGDNGVRHNALALPGES